MEKILSDNDIKFLEELAHELKTQDNMYTAKPLIFQIAEPFIDWGTDSECSDVSAFYINGDKYEDGEIVEYLRGIDEIYEGLSDNLSNDEIESILDECDIEYSYIYGRNDIRYKGSFITRESAQNHLDMNYYHYSKDSYVYTNHAWRNYELENLLNIVEKFDKSHIISGSIHINNKEQ